MKKIEKLIHINTDEKQHVSPDTVFEMCCKINEIIDFLNQLKGQQVELTNKQVTDFVKHTDQNRELNQIAKESEKQPEEKCIHYFPLSSEGVCQKCGIKFEDIKSEKQEEWRKEWRKLSFEIGSITKHQADEIEGFISERIKEAREEGRTDVLERLEKWSTNPQQGVFYDVGCNCQERLLRFLSKLLKEEK